jgi:hypothetical protein
MLRICSSIIDDFKLANYEFFVHLFTQYVVARARVIEFEKFKVSWRLRFPG